MNPVVLGYIGFGLLCCGVLWIAWAQSRDADAREETILAALRERRNTPRDER